MQEIVAEAQENALVYVVLFIIAGTAALAVPALELVETETENAHHAGN